MFLQIIENQPWVSADFLSNHLGVEKNTQKGWVANDRVSAKIIDGTTRFFNYDEIPTTTKKQKKLPSAAFLIKEQQKIEKIEKVYSELYRSFTFDFPKYLHLFQQDTSLTTQEKTEAAKLHAVWICLFEMREKGNRDLIFQFEAFKKLYPLKYKGKTGKNSFSNVLRKGRNKGVQALSFDRKKYGNNREENAKNNKAAHKFYTTVVAASGQKFSCTESLFVVNQACREAGLPEVSLSWIKKKRAEALRNIEVYTSRYGQQEANKKLPHASLKSAEYVHQQYQLDGTTLPFWGPKFKRYTLVRLVDSCSKKVVGWSVGESENTALIMEAIRDAVNKTGCIPFEVLTDNHSFNQTKEAKNLQALFEKKGCHWTITQNPQYKAIIERYNQYLDKYFKRYYGYLGQGIRSKSIEAHPKPELIDKYCKEFIEENEQRAIVLNVIETFNSTPLSGGKCPNQLFEENQHPHPITADIFDRAEMLTMETEKKIVSGQIVFKRGLIKQEFQLPASLYAKYNDCTVIVRYDNLNDSIYIFDKATHEAITSLEPKEKINNAKANQTNEDIEKLYRHTGRLKGIKSKAKDQIETITANAHKVDPEAYQRMNRLTTPKNILAELEKDGLLAAAEQRDVKVNALPIHERNFGESIASLKPKVKINESPFSPKKHTLTKFNINQINDD